MMTIPEAIRWMFAVAFVVLASVSIGSFIESTSPKGYEWGAAIMIALGIGVPLWTLAEWRRGKGKDKDEGDDK